MNNFKKIMEREKIDLVLIYSNILDPAGVRYFSNFYPINESSAMVIPLKGDPILCSGQACHEWSNPPFITTIESPIEIHARGVARFNIPIS